MKYLGDNNYHCNIIFRNYYLNLYYNMYVPTSLHQLSKEQIRKLLRGEAIRVKHGSHHKVHLSHEQHKKLMKSHSKGAGITLMFDPYQQEDHEHLRGEGFISSAKKIGSKIVKTAKHVWAEVPQSTKNILKSEAHRQVALIADKYAPSSEFGQNLAHNFEHHAHVGISGAGMRRRKHEAGTISGGSLKSVFKKVSAGAKKVQSVARPIMRQALRYGAPIVGATLGSEFGPMGAIAGEQLGAHLASGAGMRRHKKRAGKRGGALIAGGYGMEDY